MNVSESAPPEYSLTVLSTLPKGTSCSRFDGYEVDGDQTTLSVTLTNLEVAPGQLVACTADFGYTETDIPLGSDLTAGETYTVVVNGEVTNSFLARDEQTTGWVVEASPIDNVQVAVAESDPAEYSLNVISRLPRGSSCSVFNGYDVVRRFAGMIEVSVTHLEVAEDLVPCTRDRTFRLISIRAHLSWTQVTDRCRRVSREAVCTCRGTTAATTSSCSSRGRSTDYCPKLHTP